MLFAYMELAPVLQAVGVSGGAGEDPTAAGLAADVSLDEREVKARLRLLDSCGLVLYSEQEEVGPHLMSAGRQYLALRGEISEDVMRFLPHHVDDLHGRGALLRGGDLLVAEFRDAMLLDNAVAFARELVPGAFEAAVDQPFAINLFAAAAALMARLGSNEPAGCVAEELCAVAVIERARLLLEEDVVDGGLCEEEAEAALRDARGGIFELFQDDDVLGLFEMREPADAAVAGTRPTHQHLGVVDQRVEAWLMPFGGVPATGHLTRPERK